MKLFVGIFIMKIFQKFQLLLTRLSILFSG